MSLSSNEASATASRPAWHYRPHLDGVRAVAVLLVVVFHAGVHVFLGGFVGVDAFFVISGFVVTGVLLRDMNRPEGLSLVAFYDRRVRRLLPAATVTLVTVVVTWLVFATPFEQLTIRFDVASASLYVSNWRFLFSASDYFGAEILQSPVLHFWSLSVEEQFYLIWPLAALATFKIAGGRQRRVIAAIATTLVVAGIWTFVLARSDVLRAYYGTDARAYQLLLGALLAAAVFSRAPNPRSQGTSWRGVSLLALVGLVVSATSFVELGPIARGSVAAAMTALLILSIELSPESPTVSFLKNPAVAYIGRRSYAIYLWHWPINLVVGRTFSLAGWPRAGIVLLASVGVAEISHRFVEDPVRSRRFLGGLAPRNVVIVGLAVSVAVAVGAVWLLGRSSSEGAADWEFAAQDAQRTSNCVGRDASQCRTVDGAGPRVLLLGDSHLAHWAPAFEEMAARQGIELWQSTQGGCPPAVVPVVSKDGEYRSLCDDHLESALGLAAAENIDTAVLGGQYMFDFRDGDDVLTTPTDQKRDLLLDGVVELIEALGEVGVTKVVLIEPIPRATFDVPECLSVAAVQDECDFAGRVDASGIEPWLQRIPGLIEAVDVHVVDIDDVLCEGGSACPSFDNGFVTRRDNVHLTKSYSRTLWPDLFESLEASVGPDWAE